MNDNGPMYGPTYDNRAFQHEQTRPPPYDQRGIYPQLQQEPPTYVAFAPQTIDTHQTSTPGIPNCNKKPKKGRRKFHWKYRLCVCLGLLGIVAVLYVLLWYFLYYKCLIGKTCRSDDKCLNPYLRCDGVWDCSGGEDESHCFRLHGTNFMLESYNYDSQVWMPVCAENWDNNYGMAACELMGYNKQTYVSYNETSPGPSASKGYMKLRPGSNNGSRLPLHLTYSQSCSAGAVQLRCIECGQSSASPSVRIVGGTATVNGAWPWQVSLQISGQHFCGGSIISPYWILSAAHCFQKYSNPRMWTVYSGDVSLNRLSFESSKRVKKIISHEGFDTDTNDNDIALLKLHSPLTFTRTVKAVCLPTTGLDLSTGRQAWITGWGALRSYGPSPDKLNQAQVTIYSRETCNSLQVLGGRVTESMFCAGNLEGGVDTCQGDSGGPLVVKQGDIWWLAGDTSWGIGCALRNKPGVYGNVTSFLSWVHEKMQKE